MPPIHDPGAFLAEFLSQLHRSQHRTVFLLPIRTDTSDRDVEMYVDLYRGVTLYSTGQDLGLADENIATTPILAHCADLCGRDRPDAVAVIIVDDPRPDRAAPRRAHRDLITRLRGQLHADGVVLLDAWIVTGIAPGQQWQSLIDNRAGVLPATPALVIAQVQNLAPAPDPIPAELSCDSDLVAEVNRALRALNQARDATQALGVYTAPSRPELLRWVIDRLRAVLRGVTLTAEDLARVEVAMRSETVRRCLFALSSGPHGPRTQPLWTQLIRGLPTPRRAQAALQLAVSAYVQGDFDQALAALRIVLTDDRNEPTGRTLADAVATSVPAEVIRTQLAPGYNLAVELGVDLTLDPTDEDPTVAPPTD
ncbi:DUF4192 domain-containing protein [Nocardia sp. NPDC051321]|uniref:DUF4192 domain-containing protein n=1 Tax=Nocardia sp. NPDC051321 TaxID=3364323 RepID=UPI0037A2A2B1